MVTNWNIATAFMHYRKIEFNLTVNNVPTLCQDALVKSAADNQIGIFFADSNDIATGDMVYIFRNAPGGNLYLLANA